MPALSSRFLLVDRVNERLHPFSIEAVWFREIANVYAHDSIGPDIHHREVIPLEKGTVSIRVVLQIQIVFTVWLDRLHPLLFPCPFLFISDFVLILTLLPTLSVSGTFTIFFAIFFIIRANQFQFWVCQKFISLFLLFSRFL